MAPGRCFSLVRLDPWLLWVGLALLFCMALPELAQANITRNRNRARKSYFLAYRYFKQKKLDKAKSEFQKTLALVEKLPNRNKKERLFKTLGWCDIRYHLMLIEQSQGNQANVCVQLKSLVDRISFIKKTWPRWRRYRINLLLPGRFRDAKKRFGKCNTVPTSVTLTGLPPKAQVFLEVSTGPSAAAQWKAIQPRFETLKQKVKVKVKAPGYLEQIKEIDVGRWEPKSVAIELKKKPKPRVRPRKRIKKRVVKKRIEPPKPPPPPPVYTQWWFWTAIGGGVVVATVGGILIYQQVTKNDIGFKPPTNNPFP